MNLNTHTHTHLGLIEIQMQQTKRACTNKGKLDKLILIHSHGGSRRCKSDDRTSPRQYQPIETEGDGETKSMDDEKKSKTERTKTQFCIAENGIVGEKMVESDGAIAMNQLLLVRRHR